MKKLIAIFLVCLMIASMVACGKKTNDPNNTQPQNGGSSQAGSAEDANGATSNDNGAANNEDGPSAESTAPSEAPTEPAKDANKVEPTPNTPNSGENNKDEDIKVEIDNGGNSADTGSNDTTAVTPPDDNNNSNFIIDFDDLLEASKK